MLALAGPLATIQGIAVPKPQSNGGLSTASSASTSYQAFHVLPTDVRKFHDDFVEAGPSMDGYLDGELSSLLALQKQLLIPGRGYRPKNLHEVRSLIQRAVINLVCVK
jgi:hypothetical protein